MRSSTEAPPLTERQQRDNLCGPFQVARVLRESGVTEWDGEPVDQDLVALYAGSALPEAERGPQVPPGASNLRDYRYELRRVDQEASGTSLEGLVGAIERLSEGRLACTPLSGTWIGGAVEGLLSGVGDAGTRLIANVRTGHFWGSRPAVETLLAVLDGKEVADPPPADWDVGHFVELMQLLRGRRGALVAVRDSYPSLGWEGVHLQPPAALAAALTRGDGRGGGVLALGTPESAVAVEELAGRLGLQVKMWDNSLEGD